MNLYTKREHGLQPVQQTSEGTWLVGEREYTSTRQMLKVLSGHFGWRRKSYFKRSHGDTDSFEEIFLKPPKTLGIDLSVKAKDVARIFYAGFGRKINSGHEEILQEVYAGILKRNQGRGAFDPEKASFGHYVHMVCLCVLSNYIRHTRRFEPEQTGFLSYRDKKPVCIDVREADTIEHSIWEQNTGIQEEKPVKRLQAFILAKGEDPCIGILAEDLDKGYNSRDIMKRHSLGKKDFALYRERLECLTKDWAEQGCP